MVKVKYLEYTQLDGTEKTQVSRVGDGSVIFRFGTCSKCKGNGCQQCVEGVSMHPPSQPSDIVCPHFLEFKMVSGCPYDCTYCYLWRIPNLKKPREKDWMKVRTHLRRFLAEDIHPELLNLGEVGDSGIGEPLKSELLYVTMADFQTNHRILYLTKGMNTKSLLEMSKKEYPQKYLVMSYSINPQKCIELFEKRSPSLTVRLSQIKALHQRLYDIRLRIDPIFPINGWREHYHNLIDTIFHAQRIEPERITLGFPRAKQKDFFRPPEDAEWLQFIDKTHPTNWGFKIPLEIRETICMDILDYLEVHYGFTNVALCKEEQILWEHLAEIYDFLNWKKPKCNCRL